MRYTDVEVSTTIAGHEFKRCTNVHELSRALNRLAQIIAFDRANGLSKIKAFAHVEIVALLASDAERIDDNT